MTRGCNALLMAAAGLGSLAGTVRAHGSMIMPPSRNAIDSETPAWSDGKHPMTGTIQPYSCACANGTQGCDSGQSCFWFSQGCTIGCAACDNNGTRIPGWDHCPGQSINSTLLLKYRTANQDAPEGSVADVFRFNPWRAPGRAPVLDPCGVAGGTPVEAFNAAEYNATIFAKQGDHGTAVLKPRPSGTVWTRGSEARVRFQLTANHGGGYQYRLCPLSTKPLTEACFQATPLAFTNSRHTLRFADPKQDHEINATVVTEGGGIGWMRNPKPPTFRGCDYVVLPGQPHCNFGCEGCGAPNYPDDAACPTHGEGADSCSSKYPGVPSNVASDPKIFPDHTPNNVHAFSIEDTVRVPSGVPPGEYVVGFRWDCEQTSQIWSTCSDITIR